MLQTNTIELIWKPFHLKKRDFEKNLMAQKNLFSSSASVEKKSLEMLMLKDDELALYGYDLNDASFEH